MDAINLIEKKLGKSFENATKEELLSLIDELNNKKKYGLVWEEQVEEVEEFLKNNYPLLKEVKEHEIITDKDKPMNLLIEGDNLHALNTLLYTHREKLDIVHIDPPYNTGNKDFVYNDRYVDSEDSWRHSKWLSFMDKRLRLTKELLSEEGILLIHIDDNEFSQLKLLCDQIFGEKNHLGSFIWKCRTGSNDNKNNFTVNHEHVLIYSKNISKVKIKGISKDLSKYKNPDNDPNGDWMRDNPSAASGGKNSSFPITNPKTGEVYYPPKGRYWAFAEDTFKRYIEEGKVVFPDKVGVSFILKKYVKDLKSIDKPMNSLYFVEEFTAITGEGTKELKEIFDSGSPFSYPKPSSLYQKILEIVSNPNSLILDFFAGSGTSGHAVLKLNKEDDGNRQFILVTNNENNICEEVTYERLKRVINGYTTNNGKNVEGLGGNLKYYKTEFLSKDMHSQELKLHLADKSHELLCIKENSFTSHKETSEYKIFTSNDKSIAIYSDYPQQQSTLSKIHNELSSIRTKSKILYVLSLDEGDNLSYELQELVNSGIDVKAIPNKIKELFDQAIK